MTNASSPPNFPFGNGAGRLLNELSSSQSPAQIDDNAKYERTATIHLSAKSLEEILNWSLEKGILKPSFRVEINDS